MIESITAKIPVEYVNHCRVSPARFLYATMEGRNGEAILTLKVEAHGILSSDPVSISAECMRRFLDAFDFSRHKDAKGADNERD